MELTWTKPKTVRTKYGERVLRKAAPTQEFWAEWKAHKDALREDGYSVSRTDDGVWEVCHWGKHSQEVLEARKNNLDLSRAKDADIDIPVPDGLEYLPYQKAGIKFALNKDATLFGDEMGLGKTIQAIGVINKSAKIQKILVICPASLRLNWRKELEKWLILPYKIGVVNRQDYPENTDIVIINYDMVRKHHDVLLEHTWDILIIDEVHYLKNSKALRTQYILGGKDIEGIAAQKKLYLTGTPILNRPIELFTVLHSLDPETWSSWWDYAKRYCAAVRTKYGVDASGASNLGELQDKLRSTLMMRRLKKDVLTDLPPKRRQVLEIEPDAKTKNLVRKEKNAWYEKEAVLAALRGALELSKASDDPEDYKKAVRNLHEGISAQFTAMSELRHDVAVAKVPYVLEHLHNTDHKVVIFAHHKDVVAAFKKDLGNTAVVLVGDTKMEDRQKAVERFQTDDSVQYFIGSIHAAGLGITLTAASHVVFAELDWVPGNMTQAEDRCHRIGQHDSVLVQHLILEESLDAYMAQTLIDKQEIIGAAMDDDYILTPTPVTYYPSRKEVVNEAEKLTEAEVEDIHDKLKRLAAMDLDRATEKNGVGFNQADSMIGHSLAESLFLSPKQAVIGKHLIHKYRRQL